MGKDTKHDLNWLLIAEAEAMFSLTPDSLSAAFARGDLDCKTVEIDGTDYMLFAEHQLARHFARRGPDTADKSAIVKRVAEGLGTSVAGAILYDLIKSRSAEGVTDFPKQARSTVGFRLQNPVGPFGKAQHIPDGQSHKIFFNTGPQTNVYAAASGKITYVEPKNSLGNTTIKHSNGFYSVYSPTKSLGLQIGEFVKAGDLIAKAQNSGEFSFELLDGLRPVDPVPYFI